MLTPNTILQSRYLIQRQLGQGGMGAVYLATDQRFGSTVALKETFFRDENLRKAFEREAQLLNNLRHGALPVVIDHFAEGEGQFLVMQFIPGKDLSELLEEKDGAPFEVDTVLRWAYQLLDALEYLHEYKPPIIHRDIKPQNLKLTPRGEIVLLDFGLAKGSATGAPLVSLSLRGYTPHYAPLEQIQGTGTDPRSDLYALAATLHHLLTGAIPPDALTRATAAVSGQPDPLRPINELNPRVPVSISAVLYRALAQNPNQRPATATLMRQALREAREIAVSGGMASTLVEQSALQPTAPSNAPSGLTTMPPDAGAAHHTTPAYPVWQTVPQAAQTSAEAPAAQATSKRWTWPAIGAAALVIGLIVVAGIMWPRMQSSTKLPEAGSANNQPLAAKLPPPAEPMSAPPSADAGQKAAPLSFAVVSFNVVVLDEQGRITSEHKGEGNSYAEDLGNNVSLAMMEIPGRAFKMGSPANEFRHTPQESPLHEVTVPTFFLGKFEVTQAQWRAVARWPKIARDLNPDPSKFKGDDAPVDDVSWEDTEEFCARLSHRTGRTYRLPSEAEWEYACRAGTTTPFHFGMTIMPDMVNYDGTKPYGRGPKGAYRQHTMPVGNYGPANAFGLYDMHGNVAEWTQDAWHDSYAGAPANGNAWEQGSDANYRVIRGGSWFNTADECRSASRSSALKDNSYTRVGFRVAATAKK